MASTVTAKAKITARPKPVDADATLQKYRTATVRLGEIRFRKASTISRFEIDVPVRS